MNFGIIAGYVVIRFYISAIAFGVVVLHLVGVVTNETIPTMSYQVGDNYNLRQGCEILSG